MSRSKEEQEAMVKEAEISLMEALKKELPAHRKPCKEGELKGPVTVIQIAEPDRKKEKDRRLKELKSGKVLKSGDHVTENVATMEVATEEHIVNKETNNKGKEDNFREE